MELVIIMYGIFCITTALTAMIVMLNPVLKELRVSEPLNVLGEYPNLARFTFTILTTLVAPAILFILVIPGQDLLFMDSLTKSFKEV